MKGFNVLTALTYNDAVTCLEEKTVNLVITDLAMPEKSGLDLLQMLHDHEQYRDVPVIAQSGFGSQMSEQVLALQPVRLFQKPVDFNELLWTVRDTLNLPQD